MQESEVRQGVLRIILTIRYSTTSIDPSLIGIQGIRHYFEGFHTTRGLILVEHQGTR